MVREEGQWWWDIWQVGNVLFLRPCGGYIVFILLFLKLNIKVNDDLCIFYLSKTLYSHVVELHIMSKIHPLLGLSKFRDF